MMSKKPLLYRVGRFILGPIYRFYYNPKIEGLENLKVDGSAIIASNHIHLYDQCNIIISTKDIITYMAKKEYFDSNKTRWFFKSVGCIPVDRSKKDSNATESALKVLNDNNSIGIFPEGTRNALKEERVKDLYNKYFNDLDYRTFNKKLIDSKPLVSQINLLEKLIEDKRLTEEDFKDNIYNVSSLTKKLYEEKIITEEEYYNSYLLDFKFGAVSMASKTNSYLIPVGVTGDYKFRSKNLKIKIGKPFKINDLELSKANELLYNSIRNIIKKNLKGE